LNAIQALSQLSYSPTSGTTGYRIKLGNRAVKVNLESFSPIRISPPENISVADE
jgi:hypothetical protein